MSQEKVKVQLMLPKDLVLQIEQDAKQDFLKKSTWFEKLARLYFEHKLKNKEESPTKKVITLNI